MIMALIITISVAIFFVIQWYDKKDKHEHDEMKFGYIP